MVRLSLLTGLPDGVRLALAAAAEHPDGWFPPGVAPATLGWMRRKRLGRPFGPSGNWTITPAGRDALARADLALRNEPRPSSYPSTVEARDES